MEVSDFISVRNNAIPYSVKISFRNKDEAWYKTESLAYGSYIIESKTDNEYRGKYILVLGTEETMVTRAFIH